jgi:hypothetical protein
MEFVCLFCLLVIYDVSGIGLGSTSKRTVYSQLSFPCVLVGYNFTVT